MATIQDRYDMRCEIIKGTYGYKPFVIF